MSEYPYKRKQLEAFFKWRYDTRLRHYHEDYDAEEEAKKFASLRPNVDGFITFQTKFRGTRFFWIKDGKAEELDPMKCFLRVHPEFDDKPKEPSKSVKELIREKVFGKKSNLDRKYKSPNV